MNFAGAGFWLPLKTARGQEVRFQSRFFAHGLGLDFKKGAEGRLYGRRIDTVAAVTDDKLLHIHSGAFVASAASPATRIFLDRRTIEPQRGLWS
jgi:hypothetical protein